MKYSIMLKNEVGEEMVIREFTSSEYDVLISNGLIDVVLDGYRAQYPEAQWIWVEEEKSYADYRIAAYEEAYREAFEYAEKCPEDVGYQDPDEYASDMAAEAVSDPYWSPFDDPLY